MQENLYMLRRIMSVDRLHGSYAVRADHLFDQAVVSVCEAAMTASQSGLIEEPVMNCRDC